jgi:4-hydroxyphenylpyruvate dioxygenase-like putative hemolysin
VSLRFENPLRLVGFEFFELLQRKGDDGFGESNFEALCHPIGRDRIRRRVVDQK